MRPRRGSAWADSGPEAKGARVGNGPPRAPLPRRAGPRWKGGRRAPVVASQVGWERGRPLGPAQAAKRHAVFPGDSFPPCWTL